MPRTVLLSAEDHARVSEAVFSAEQSTDGEIVTIVAQTSDAYHDVGLHFAILAMLLVPGFALLSPSAFETTAIWVLGGWHSSLALRDLMLVMLGGMILLFLVVRYLLALRPIRMALTPAATKTRRVHRRAVSLFRTAVEARTAGRTGVLIYLSLDEHRAEIVADKAINEKVDSEVWGDAMAALIGGARQNALADGMIQAVGLVGGVLAQHFPRTPTDRNELPDRLIEL